MGLADDGDPSQTLTRFLRRPGPALLHVPIGNHEMVFPMVPPGAANREMIGQEMMAQHPVEQACQVNW